MGTTAALALLAVGWMQPATAPPPSAEPAPEPEAPSLEIESPGALGAGYGIGVDLSFEALDQLDLVGGGRAVSFGSPDGERESEHEVPVDAEGLRWKQTTVGLQVPVALPPLSSGGGARIDWSLLFEAAGVDGTLELDERPGGDVVRERPSSTDLAGRGSRFGVGFQATASLCSGCRWAWSGGYRYRTLRGFDLEQEIDCPSGADPAEEDGELQTDDHELTARVGYSLGRVTPWLGVRGRRTESAVDHVVTFRDVQGLERFDRLRLEIESEQVSAVVGADVRLAHGVVGRVEGTFGDGGDSVLLKVVTFPRPRGDREARGDRRPGGTGQASPLPPAGPSDATAGTPEEIADQRRRAEELADTIAPRVDELRRRFVEEKNRLEREAGRDRPLPLAGVLALLDELEEGLRDALGARELLPTLAWFLDLLERARTDLTTDAGEVSSRFSAGAPPSGLAFASRPARQDPPSPNPPASRSRARGWLATILDELRLLETRADTRRLTQDLCVRSEPRPNAKVILWPRVFEKPNELADADTFEQETEGRLHVFYRGLYAYSATLGGHQPIGCPAADPAARCAPVNLWKNDGPLLVCNFDPDIGHCVLQAGDVASCGR